MNQDLVNQNQWILRESKAVQRLGVLCLLMGLLPIGIGSAIAATPISNDNPLKTVHHVSSIEVKPQANSAIAPFATDTATASETEPMAQVTSVSQLSDVKPTDWAFQALQSLVERYGCIVGYPDKTYWGNRALTRYEFAAGLNACLDRVNELIAAGTADLVKKEDLLALQKLQEEFATELATLRGRVGALEARTATLEKQQFSTTTKLSGEVIFSLASAYGAAPGFKDAQPVFNDRVRLNLTTSFTGKDLLITGLQAYNFGQGPSALLGGSGSLGGTLGYGDPVFGNASQVSLGYAPQFPETNPKIFLVDAAIIGLRFTNCSTFSPLPSN